MDFHFHAPKVKLTPREKRIMHWLIMAWIAIILYQEGGKSADWSFLALSMAVEMG